MPHDHPEVAVEAFEANAHLPGYTERVGKTQEVLLREWSGGAVEELLEKEPSALERAFCLAVRGAMH